VERFDLETPLIVLLGIALRQIPRENSFTYRTPACVGSTLTVVDPRAVVVATIARMRVNVVPVCR